MYRGAGDPVRRWPAEHHHHVRGQGITCHYKHCHETVQTIHKAVPQTVSRKVPRTVCDGGNAGATGGVNTGADVGAGAGAGGGFGANFGVNVQNNFEAGINGGVNLGGYGRAGAEADDNVEYFDDARLGN